MSVQESLYELDVTRHLVDCSWHLCLNLGTIGHIYQGCSTASNLLDGWKVEMKAFSSWDQANHFICMLEDAAQAIVLTPSLTTVRIVGFMEQKDLPLKPQP